MHTHFAVTALFSLIILGWIYTQTKNLHARYILFCMAVMLTAATLLMYVTEAPAFIRWGLSLSILAAFCGALLAFSEGWKERKIVFMVQRAMARRKIEPKLVPVLESAPIAGSMTKPTPTGV